ncbi:MAG TPA: hypothetical protein VNS58_13815 [Puia sp.]|nr:hypothetical protein [Puia sp.]
MPCTDKNPLIREGTSLLNRILAALSAGYSKVDEREAADIILFAKRYGACLNYFKDDNTVDGNWQVLMQSDVSVSLATLSRINVQEITDYKKRIYKKIKLSGTDADAKREFKYLFDVLFSLATLIDQQFNLLPDDFEYKQIFRDVIINKLQLPLANIELCFNDFKTAGLLDYTTKELDNDAPVDVISNGTFTRNDLGTEWKTAVPDISITRPMLPTEKEVIVYIINHNLFNAQIESLLNGISSVVTRANDLFIQTLGDYPKHTPHLALFLSFIEIYIHEQDELNRYTQRHLDFYYKEVLQLMNKTPDPDSAHLVFELQKPVSEHRLLKNTLFKGGKDVTGKEINYALTDDVVINKATVSKIHSLQIVHGSKDLLKASPIANSDDGQGAKVTAADKSWFAFGDIKKIKNAKAGFAIASNLLFLNEGTRTITITANFISPVPGIISPSPYNLNCFTAQFTGKKKWEDMPQPVVSSNSTGTQLIFTITLSPDAPAVLPYAEKIHARNMQVALPVVTIYLDQDAANALPYTSLCNKELSSVAITVEVLGVKDLMLSNDNGVIDASKPFKPFGDFPDTNAGFYIGSKELFQKQLSFLELETDWKSPSGGPALNTLVHYLRQSDFESTQYTIVTGATADSITFSGGNNAFIPTAIDFSKNEKITATALEGFLRIKLNSHEYSLARHLEKISAALSSGTSLVSDGKTPSSYTIKIPATPVPDEIALNNLSIHYKADVTVSFASNAPVDNHLFYQLNTFGFARVNNSLVDASPDTESTKPISLLQDVINEGELFIGLENAAASMVVTILFQVADGSSNPQHDMEILNWYYLAGNNNWKRFKKEHIIDNTNNLTQSGVVTLTLGGDAVNTNTLLEEGLHWIKVTAQPYADAVCKIVSIQAQAAKVQLQQDEASQVEFRQLLPANSISKLLVSDAAIKTIQQPFDSFDGRTRESDDHFYVRVSERLRHKQRAITIWDYEHIILEMFFKIFKVKCLNHSGFYKQQGEDVFCENYPGHVSIITIPDQNNNTNINPLRPYTPVGLLANITDYLGTITSPFVKLHVKNPQFEEIQLDFMVKFYEHLDEAFYLQLLNTEIEQFLCPWAFNNKTEISFGGKIYKSVLLNFVEERPYVDYVTCFKMNHFIRRDSSGVTVLSDIEEATASTSRSILVSYFDEDNNIKHKIVSPATCIC